MNTNTKDEIQGTVHEVKGKVKVRPANTNILT